MPTLTQLTVALRTYLTADTRDDARRVVATRPELWTDPADDLLTQLIDRAIAEGSVPHERFVRERRDLLRRCRQVGVAAAFAEAEGEPPPPTDWHALLMDWLRASTWDASREFLAAHLDLLSDAAGAMLEEMSAAAREQGLDDVVGILEAHRAILRRARDEGLDTAQEERSAG